MSFLVLPMAAFGAGVVSFTSPCCLPLVPGYLSYVSALPVSGLPDRAARAMTVRAAVLFVLGFAVVFTFLGTSFAFLGAAVLRHVPSMVRFAGLGIIVLGLAMMGVIRVPFLMRERRFDLTRAPRGPRGATFLGMAFAVGWVPCIGPVLATVLTAAAATQTAAWGAVLLMCYSLGLGLPFILMALGLQRARSSTAWLRRHGRTIEAVGGALLVVVGILFVSGVWREIFLPLQRRFAELGWPPV